MKGFSFIESKSFSNSDIEYSIWRSKDNDLFCLCLGKSFMNKCFDPEPKIIITATDYKTIKNAFELIKTV